LRYRQRRPQAQPSARAAGASPSPCGARTLGSAVAVLSGRSAVALLSLPSPRAGGPASPPPRRRFTAPPPAALEQPLADGRRVEGATARGATLRRGPITAPGPRAEGPPSLRRRSRVLPMAADNPLPSSHRVAGASPHCRDAVGGGNGSSPRSPPSSARSRRPLNAREGGTVFTLSPYKPCATESWKQGQRCSTPAPLYHLSRHGPCQPAL
jgi:hypothetical protein